MPFLARFSSSLIPTMYWLLGLFITIIYASFKSILYFLIEDKFNLPFLHPLPSFLGFFQSSIYEYGYMASWLLFGGLGFLTCFTVAQKLCKIPENKDFLKKRHKVIWLILIIAFFSLLFDVLHITRGFLTGRIDGIGLTQTLITFTLSLGIAVFAFLDLKQNFASKSFFSLIVNLKIIAILISGVTISLIMAPPSYIYKMRMDMERFEAANKLRYIVTEYAKRHNNVPNSIQELQNEPNVSKDELIDKLTKDFYNYKKLNDKKYEISIDFQTNFEQAQRISQKFKATDLKQGTNILVYNVNVDKKGNVTQTIRITTNIINGKVTEEVYGDYS